MSTLFDTAKQVNFFEDLNPEEIKYATIKAEVAVALFRKRKELGMTQAAFAKYMDVTQSTISKWESGDHNFSLEALERPLSKLGLTIKIIPTTIASPKFTVCSSYTSSPEHIWKRASSVIQKYWSNQISKMSVSY
jgi:hypothetical protein